ncbi:MAG: hypothetical protein AAFX52_00485 [Pseudomonadota bacterium]
MNAIDNDETLKKELRTLFFRIAMLLAGGVVLGLIVGLLGASHLGTVIVGFSFAVSAVLMVLLMGRFAKQRVDGAAKKPTEN